LKKLKTEVFRGMFLSQGLGREREELHPMGFVFMDASNEKDYQGLDNKRLRHVPRQGEDWRVSLTD
jgi:hypothetical protein